MPNQRYGITFPFVDSQEGFFLGLNSFADSEIKSNLIHLILTQKGSRYFLPAFGTNLIKYVFEPLDMATQTNIDREIREAVQQFIPNLVINNVEVKTIDDIRLEEQTSTDTNSLDQNTFDFTGTSEAEYSVRIRIDYSMGDDVFETKDFVIINL
tara:strand:- start:225 stop:686 length:462 start_codon:yes stop_codon:yes gene_type:complete